MSLYLWPVSRSTLRTQTAHSFTISKEGKKNIHKHCFVCRFTHLAIYICFSAKTPRNSLPLPFAPVNTLQLLLIKETFLCACVCLSASVLKRLKKVDTESDFVCPAYLRKCVRVDFFITVYSLLPSSDLAIALSLSRSRSRTERMNSNRLHQLHSISFVVVSFSFNKCCVMRVSRSLESRSC